jgi:nitrate reductase NapAB chaperone NapD
MPICSYLVIPEGTATGSLAARLSGLPGCEVVAAENAPVLILLTDTDTPEADERLRGEIESMREVQALVLTFGEIDPDTSQADPLGGSRRRPGLPVLDPPQAGRTAPGDSPHQSRARAGEPPPPPGGSR